MRINALSPLFPETIQGGPSDLCPWSETQPEGSVEKLSLCHALQTEEGHSLNDCRDAEGKAFWHFLNCYGTFCKEIVAMCET